MDVHYHIVDTIRKEYLDPGSLLSDSRWHKLLYGLSGHAMAILLRDADGIVEGRWAGDPLYAVGDTHTQTILHRLELEEECNKNVSALDILRDKYVDITPLLIAHLCEDLGIKEKFLQAADSDPVMLIDLMNIAQYLGAKDLRGAIVQRYGKDWHELYNGQYALLDETGQSSQIREIHHKLITDPSPSPETHFVQRQIVYQKETTVEQAHAIEIAAIEGNVITAIIQRCPATHLDGKLISQSVSGISYFGKMQKPDKLFVLRVLLSCWNNLPSGIHFLSQVVSKAKAQVLHEQAIYYTTLTRV